MDQFRTRQGKLALDLNIYKLYQGMHIHTTGTVMGPKFERAMYILTAEKHLFWAWINSALLLPGICACGFVASRDLM